MHQQQSRSVALCGVLGALSLVLMLMGNLIPLATYCAPALAAVLLIPVQEEYGSRNSLLLYAAVALLSLILLPDKELAAMYALVLGYYPALRPQLNRIRARIVRVAAKLAVFNMAVLVTYGLLLAVFTVPELAAEFNEMGRPWILALLAIGNLAFVIYDAALDRLTMLYRLRWRKRLKRFL